MSSSNLIPSTKLYKERNFCRKTKMWYVDTKIFWIFYKRDYILRNVHVDMPVLTKNEIKIKFKIFKRWIYLK